jgi:hypothetical protein
MPALIYRIEAEKKKMNAAATSEPDVHAIGKGPCYGASRSQSCRKAKSISAIANPEANGRPENTRQASAVEAERDFTVVQLHSNWLEMAQERVYPRRLILGDADTVLTISR